MSSQCRKRPKKCGKRTDNNPARPRYWNRGRLVLNKIRRMVRSSNMTPRQAFEAWKASRKRHLGKVEMPTLRQIDSIR